MKWQPSIVDLSQKHFSEDEEEKNLPWLKMIKPFIMNLKDLKNESVAWGSYVILIEASGLKEFYIVWTTESITLKRRVGYGVWY